MLEKNMRAVGVLLLVGFVCALYMAQTAEAAPKPAAIVNQLQAKLDRILKEALKKENALRRKVKRIEIRNCKGNVTVEVATQQLLNLKSKTAKQELKFNRKLDLAAQRKLQKLSIALGGNVVSDPFVYEALEIYDVAKHKKKYYFLQVVEALDVVGSTERPCSLHK